MSERQYITNADFRTAKANLTRLINRAKKAGPTQRVDALKAIITHVDALFLKWDRGNYAYPDDWSRWQRAKDDAEYDLRRERNDW